MTEALDAGSRTTLEAKRQLLGRAVGRALGGGTALVDRAQIMTAVVVDIEAPHVIALERIRDAEAQGTDSNDSGKRVSDVAEAELAPVLSSLERNGLLTLQTGFGGGPVVAG